MTALLSLATVALILALAVSLIRTWLRGLGDDLDDYRAAAEPTREQAERDAA